MANPTFPGLPPWNGVNISDFFLKARLTVNGCLNGKTNNTGTVTLNTSTSSTTVVLASGRLGPNTVILFEPTTANAAIEISTATMWVSTKDPLNNQFILTNAVNNKNDRIFNFVLIG
jgi:hypothetical protein